MAAVEVDCPSAPIDPIVCRPDHARDRHVHADNAASSRCCAGATSRTAATTIRAVELAGSEAGPAEVFP